MSDEIIYVLLAIGYVAYSFYKQWSKAKDAGRQRGTAPENEAEPPDEDEFKKVIEEILFDKPPKPAAPPEPRPAAVRRERKSPPAAGWEQTAFPGTVENMTPALDTIGKEGESALKQRLSGKKQARVVRAVSSEGQKHSSYPIDLRQAIIYDAIFNRPQF